MSAKDMLGPQWDHEHYTEDGIWSGDDFYSKDEWTHKTKGHMIAMEEADHYGKDDPTFYMRGTSFYWDPDEPALHAGSRRFTTKNEGRAKAWAEAARNRMERTGHINRLPSGKMSYTGSRGARRNSTQNVVSTSNGDKWGSEYWENGKYPLKFPDTNPLSIIWGE